MISKLKETDGPPRKFRLSPGTYSRWGGSSAPFYEKIQRRHVAGAKYVGLPVLDAILCRVSQPIQPNPRDIYSRQRVAYDQNQSAGVWRVSTSSTTS